MSDQQPFNPPTTSRCPVSRGQANIFGPSAKMAGKSTANSATIACEARKFRCIASGNFSTAGAGRPARWLEEADAAGGGVIA
jgi:hypothetical protein